VKFKTRAPKGARVFCYVAQVDMYTILVYVWQMHIIAKPALIRFWEKHPDAQSSLKAWHKIIRMNDFGSFSELKKTFASVDHVKGLTVFNIAGNKYRLIAAIHYNRRKVYIRHVLTHAEYDFGNWRKP
jgi:mRNA interferase HigB